MPQTLHATYGHSACWRRAVRRGAVGGGLIVLAIAPGFCSPAMPALTNVAQLRQFAVQAPGVSHLIRLEGNVWWASPAQGRLVVQDASGAAELEMNWAGPPTRAGQRVLLHGNGTITRQGAAFRLGAKGAVVDNDGVHGMSEKSGGTYLKAGWQPIRVEWFNGVEKAGLVVEYEGPDLPRRRMPDSVLFRMPGDSTSASNSAVSGLEWRCFEGLWEVLPEFQGLTPVKTGNAANFGLQTASRVENVALQFSGFLDVLREGFYSFFLTSDDGSRLFVGEPTFRLENIGEATMPDPRRIAIGQFLRDEEEGQWVALEGNAAFARETPPGLLLELSGGAGSMRVEMADGSGLSPEGLKGQRIRATGFCQSALTADGQRVASMLLTPDARHIQFIDGLESIAFPGSHAEALAPLTTADSVHRLKREEAQRGLPARIRGVVTSVLPKHQAVTIQDHTRGLYVVDISTNRAGPPRIGESLEIEGVTDPGLFAPCVHARRVSSLGAGRLPAPVRPTWDQLMNGSLDAQYVEVQGILTAVQPEAVTLLTDGGVLRTELRVTGTSLDQLKRHENALVRVRGCLFASWDYRTRQVKMGEVRIYDADLLVDQPAPTDLFSSPAKSAADLLLFDPHAGVFQRVKVSGQITHVRGAEHFMMDSGHGVRFLAKDPVVLQTGDLVEAVGFPDLLGAASPVLREAVARRIGRAGLPAAEKLTPDNLVRAEHDATRVKVEGVLVGVRGTQTDSVLEMQNGVRTFMARAKSNDDFLHSLPAGSRLELTGVYEGLGGSRAANQDITSFELLLHSPSDIVVLARPPWWTLKRLLAIMGALAVVLAATGLWITQLRRQVDERTAELGAQIQQRQRAEHQRAMEQERARIAQDLHDELGSGITEISMLAARAKSASAPDEKRSRHLEQVGDKAREMVTALDEIVWATNPGHDSLASLVSYFSLYADRFLSLANIAWRLEGPTGRTDHVIDSRHRHQLFLAFKEALTNIVRHSGATEVRVSIQVEAGEVRLAIADNGRGLPADPRTDGMDGVANMRSRLERLGGRFEATSEPGGGTRLRLCVPVNG